MTFPDSYCLRKELPRPASWEWVNEELELLRLETSLSKNDNTPPKLPNPKVSPENEYCTCVN